MRRDNKKLQQSLTVRYQLRKALSFDSHDDEDDDVDDWRHSYYDCYDEYDENELLDRLFSEIEDLAKDFSTNRPPKDPVQLSKITRRFLRSKIEYWKDYEIQFEHEYLLDRAKEYNLNDKDSKERSLDIYIKLMQAHIRTGTNPIVLNKARRDIWPCSWMFKDVAISKKLATKQGQRRIQLYNDLWRDKKDVQDSQKLIYKTKASNSKARVILHILRDEHSIHPIVVQPDSTHLARSYEVSQDTIRNDIIALQETGALIKIGKPGSTECSLFLIGKKNAYRCLPLIKNSSKCRGKLANYL